MATNATNEASAAAAAPRQMAGPAAAGLTSVEAQARLKSAGLNLVREERAHPLKDFVRRFWAPIPWLLEATIILQLFLHEKVEAAVIGGLLVLNATLSLFQEGRAQRALALLRQQLRVRAPVLRDGKWTDLPAEELVPGDLVHLRQGTIVPADIRLTEGALLVDQSALTGESAAITIVPGKMSYAGSMVRNGEATGEITTTGARTVFGKTAELVRTAGAANRQEHFWCTRPSLLLLASSMVGLGVTAFLALGGVLMPALAAPLLFTMAGAGIIYFAALDWVKAWLFAKLNLR